MFKGMGLALLIFLYEYPLNRNKLFHFHMIFKKTGGGGGGGLKPTPEPSWISHCKWLTLRLRRSSLTQSCQSLLCSNTLSFEVQVSGFFGFKYNLCQALKWHM